MDKDLEKKVRKLGNIERAKDSAEFRREVQLANAAIVSENYEDSIELIGRLKKKLNIYRGSLVAGVLVFIIILLYMIYTVVTKTPVIEPEIEPASISINQQVINKNLILTLEAPSFDEITIPVYKLSELLEGQAQVNLGDGCIYENYGEDGWKCVLSSTHNHELDTEVYVYKVSDLESALANTKKNYSFTDSIPTASDSLKEVLTGYIVGDEVVAIYNDDIASKTDISVNDLATKITTNTFKFTFYEQVDEESIKKVITDVFRGSYYNVNFTDDATMRDTLAELFDRLQELSPKMSYEYGDMVYNYYEDVKQDGDVKVYNHSGVDEVPEFIYNYTITDVEVVYNTLGCAYYYLSR